MTPIMPYIERNLIDYSTFRKVCMVVGSAARVEVNPSAKIPAYILRFDMGASLIAEHEQHHRKSQYTSSAQLCTNHEIADLTGRQLLIVANFPRRQIGKMMSDCLTTGVQDARLSNPDEKRETTVAMTTSEVVREGARVGILAEDEILETNPRNLDWSQFMCLDMRVALIEAVESCIAHADEINRVVLQLDLGELGKQSAIGLLHRDCDTSTLIDRQVLVLTNLGEDDREMLFGDKGPLAVLLTTGGGRALIEPMKRVTPNFKLA